MGLAPLGVRVVPNVIITSSTQITEEQQQKLWNNFSHFLKNCGIVHFGLSFLLYYRGIYSAKHLQILQNVQFQIQIQCFHNFRKYPDICTESGFYKVHDECFLWQHWIQIPKQKQNLSRQPGQSCPLCRPVFAKSEMQISSKFSLSHRNFS